jgi:uncharacterized protein YpuA (DUF1002 family)
MSKELTPTGKLFEQMAALFFGQDSIEYEQVMDSFKKTESSYIRKKEREAARKAIESCCDVINTLEDIETFLNENYPL